MRIKRIHRVVKKDLPFTIIVNTAVRDTSLSFRAFGILVECLSHKDDWEITRDWLQKRRSEGKEAIQAAMRELESAGYAVFVCERLDGGRIVSQGWEWHEEPVPLQQRTNRTQRRGNRLAGKPAVRQASQYSGTKYDPDKSSIPAKGAGLKKPADSGAVTKETLLKGIKTPKGMPDQEEFQEFLEKHCKHALDYRQDKYEELVRNKWHTWDRKKSRWDRIFDWRAYVRGFDERIAVQKSNGRGI